MIALHNEAMIAEEEALLSLIPEHIDHLDIQGQLMMVAGGVGSLSWKSV